MRMPVSPKHRQEMVKEALKEQAPKMFRQLERRGELQKFLQDRAELMWETYQENLDSVLSQVDQGPKRDFREQNSELLHALSRLTELTLARCLEFQDEEPAEEG